MKQKRFIDIENLKESENELSLRNDTGFVLGDIIQVSEKIDGANACATYDPETDSLVAFSRNKELSFSNNLSGFWNHVQGLDPTHFKKHPGWFVFGEWGLKNKIIYDQRFKYKWIVYDIYDQNQECWLPQDDVKRFCEETGLEYIHVYYQGPFMGWEHVRSFLNSPNYGDSQEGVVIKNLDRLSDENRKVPFYLKIVNKEFKESMAPKQRVIDPEKENRKAEAIELASFIITRNRVEKELYKMRNEGDLPEKIGPNDMGLVARTLPKRIYDDCIKEEKETVMACGENFSNICKSLTMKHAREIILG